MATLEGRLDASGLRVALLVSRFNSFITESLLQGASGAFARHGGDPAQLDVVRMPGAFEMPAVAARLARGGRYDALVALGAVIRGATPHFDYVSATASQGLAAVARETGVPVGFGLLTCDTVEQAIERAGTKAGNKGEEAMATAIEMACLFKELP